MTYCSRSRVPSGNFHFRNALPECYIASYGAIWKHTVTFRSGVMSDNRFEFHFESTVEHYDMSGSRVLTTILLSMTRETIVMHSSVMTHYQLWPVMTHLSDDSLPVIDTLWSSYPICLHVPSSCCRWTCVSQMPLEVLVATFDVSIYIWSPFEIKSDSAQHLFNISTHRTWYRY